MVSWHRQPFERKPEINFRAPFVYAILFFSALQRKNITKQNNNNNTELHPSENKTKSGQQHSEKIIAQL